jgi:hypothetical protein
VTDHFLKSDPALNPNFRRFASPTPPTRAARRWLLITLLAEAAEARRHGDHAAALAAESDAARLAREVRA